MRVVSAVACSVVKLVEDRGAGLGRIRQNGDPTWPPMTKVGHLQLVINSPSVTGMDTCNWLMIHSTRLLLKVGGMVIPYVASDDWDGHLH
jgi:hypothetical protein